MGGVNEQIIPNQRKHLTLKVPEKLQLYGHYVYYVVHICDFGMLRVKEYQWCMIMEAKNHTVGIMVHLMSMTKMDTNRAQISFSNLKGISINASMNKCLKQKSVQFYTANLLLKLYLTLYGSSL